jgi:predicted dehydrogenase
MSLTRRNFLKAAAVGVAAPLFVPQTAFGANETVNIGIIGLGIRGAETHLKRFAKQQNVKVVALADPDRARTDATVAKLEKEFGQKADGYADMRKIFERKDVDAVSVAIMNHWHGLATIWACEAGKHVYCEKPLSHFIWEGRQMVNAAEKYNRLIQCGTQNRSRQSTRDAIEYIKSGKIGKIKYITAFANKLRKSIGKRTEPLPIPATIDYDLWCGPAKDGPIYRDRLQYDCSFTWNMGDGESSNQGVHEIDIARWVLGINEMPRRVISLGGRFIWDDAGDVPNTQIIYYDYPVPILYEVHNMRESKDPKSPETNTFGFKDAIMVHGEGGQVLIGNYDDSVAFDTEGKKITSWSFVGEHPANGGDTHFENFIAAVRSGRKEDLNADVLTGHISTTICNAGNVSYRLGKPASVSEQKAAIADIPFFGEMHERYLKHIAQHDVDPNTTILGPWLTCDPANECFKDNAEANKIVHGWYRTPYTVKEVV